MSANSAQRRIEQHCSSGGALISTGDASSSSSPTIEAIESLAPLVRAAPSSACRPLLGGQLAKAADNAALVTSQQQAAPSIFRNIVLARLIANRATTLQRFCSDPFILSARHQGGADRAAS